MPRGEAASQALSPSRDTRSGDGRRLTRPCRATRTAGDPAGDGRDGPRRAAADAAARRRGDAGGAAGPRQGAARRQRRGAGGVGGLGGVWERCGVRGGLLAEPGPRAGHAGGGAAALPREGRGYVDGAGGAVDVQHARVLQLPAPAGPPRHHAVPSPPETRRGTWAALGAAAPRSTLVSYRPAAAKRGTRRHHAARGA